jgi:two-component system sensor histidine kinase DegS
MPSDRATPPPAPAAGADPSAPSGVTGRAASDAATLERELGEIEMLVTQARTEAGRHEQKRAAAAERLAALVEKRPGEAADIVEQYAQLVTLTRRAAVMEAQVDVLEGKRKALARFHEAISGPGMQHGAAAGEAVATHAPAADESTDLPPALSRVVLAAQEDLRREIARAMHDGPAQSLTNIVLQAKIVERLVAADPEAARGEVRQLVSMVQQTLDATKSFIFDVRPMVLDDLGLVPTIRRAARDRGRRAGVAVEFDSIGQDRRLPMELESGLFRMLDESLSAYLAAAPDHVSVRLDWGDRLEAHVVASRGGMVGGTAAEEEAEPEAPTGKDLPPALAAMMDERRADRRAKADAARDAARIVLPANAWREIQRRAGTIGVETDLLSDGAELRLVVDLPAAEPVPADG